MTFKIISISLNNKTFKLCENLDNNDNVYTLITGKNGLGKTRLLNLIIFRYIKDTFKKIYVSRPSTIDKNINNCNFDIVGDPFKIIVHTNSKYDKFPVSNEANLKKYININNISGYNHDSSIFYKILIKKNVNYKSVRDTLNYLGYDSKIKFELGVISSTTSAGYLDLVISKYSEELNEIGFDITKTPNRLSRSNKKFLNLLFYFYERNLGLPLKNELKIIYKIYLGRFIYEYNNEITIDLNNDKNDYGFLTKYEFSILSKYNIIRVNSIFLQKLNSEFDFFNNYEEFVSFYHLSSGQKSIINTLLGISSVIEDNSMICIDEPEISLHPEWQEEIIIKLQEAFIDKKGCHFLIATHSPQVVSGLKCNNGYILDLENNILHKSIDYSKKSADYQLAKLFNAPGYNNEYIIKICLFLLSKIKDNVNFDSNDLSSISELKAFQLSLKNDDPVYYLVKEVISLAEV